LDGDRNGNTVRNGNAVYRLGVPGDYWSISLSYRWALLREVVVRSVLALPVLISFAIVSLSSAQDQPNVGIVSPVPGAIIVGTDVTIEVVITDFTLVPPTGTDENPGEGHIIYYLDMEPASPFEPAIPSDPAAIYAVSDQLTHTFEDVAPGPHYVVVLLVHDNDVPVFPPSIDKVSFTVAAPSETPRVEPTPGPTEEARSVSIEEVTPTPTPTGPTPTRLPTLTPAVLAAGLPNGGDTPAGESKATAESGGGPSAWLFVVAAAGIAALAGGGAAALAMRRDRR